MRRLLGKTHLRRRARTVRRRLWLRTAGQTTESGLARVARGDGPIVVGPWLSEIGHEVLYWLPFLAWFADRYDVGPERLTVISRGGAGCWYRDLAQTRADVFELLTPDDYKRLNQQRKAEMGFQKQFAPTHAERSLIRRILEARGQDLDGARSLHPSRMYRLFTPVWEGWRPLSRIRQWTLNRPLPRLEVPQPLAHLEDYVAVKFYFSDCFPDTPRNRSFVREILAALASNHDVVLLSTGLDLDDHRDTGALSSARIHSLEPWMTARDNLELQTRAISGARALVGTYGGFSYLGPFLGVSSFSFFSEENFEASHLDLMRGSLSDLRPRWPGVEFLAQRVEDFEASARLGALLAGAGR
jgi:hypothetical protein